jgi:putative ABC transport system substrate-binding protein
MRRREFLGAIGGMTAAWPLVAGAQQSTVPTIGFVGSASPELFANRVKAVRQGLSEAGYTEGRNVAIEFRWARGRNDLLPALVADLVSRQVSVIVTAGGLPAARAAKAATTSIPIVFQTGLDPVQVGLVKSLSRPSGNLTGVTTLSLEIRPKQLELLRKLVPQATLLGELENETNPGSKRSIKLLQTAAHALGVALQVVSASSDRDFEGAFATLVRVKVGGLVISSDPFITSRLNQLGALALRHSLPAVSTYRTFVSSGGLASYGADIAEAYRLVGVYTGRVLRGEKPADLPVQQSTKLQLIINLKTAKALGITVPQSLLVRADEVVD